MLCGTKSLDWLAKLIDILGCVQKNYIKFQYSEKFVPHIFSFPLLFSFLLSSPFNGKAIALH